MWPMLLDYTHDECRKLLRKLELEAYASVISAFRAQGEMNKEKKKMLQELSVALSISLERHRAEVRRAVNDEELNTIANRLVGPNTSSDWTIEGRRVVPLMVRRIPQTAFTAIADYAAEAQVAKNATMPIPSVTGCKDSSERENKEEKAKRKRSPSLDSCSTLKKMAMENSHTTPIPVLSSKPEEVPDVAPRIPSPIPHSVIQAVLGKETIYPFVERKAKHAPASAKQKTTPNDAFKYSSVPPSSVGVTVPLNSYQSTPRVKTAPPPTPMSPYKPPTNSNLSLSMSSQLVTSIKNVHASMQSPSVINSMPAPLFSVSSVPTPIVSTSHSGSSQMSRPRSKVFMSSNKGMRPRLFSSTLNSGQPQSLGHQGFAPQMPTPNSAQQPLQKTVSPMKTTRGATPRMSMSSSSLPCSMATFTTPSPRSVSPVSTLHKVVSPIPNSFRTPTPNSFKQTLPPKPSPKGVCKATSLKQQSIGGRTLLTTTVGPKATISKCTTSVVPSSPSTRPAMQPTLKTPSAPVTASARMPHAFVPKTVQAQTQPKGNPSVAKMIHYRNDTGLKIISQNMQSSRILPKPSSAGNMQVSAATTALVTATTTAAATTAPNKMPPTTHNTVNVTASARIVNFPQPMARFTRAVLPSAISSMNIANTLPTTGLRVTLPPVSVNNSSVIRAGIPAKPNVIVVHKAQVWPQTPGATIVMTSTGPLSRISNEAIEEAVSMMQRQDSCRLTAPSTTFKAVTLQQAIMATPSISGVASALPKAIPTAVTTTTTSIAGSITKTPDNGNKVKDLNGKQLLQREKPPCDKVDHHKNITELKSDTSSKVKAVKSTQFLIAPSVVASQIDTTKSTIISAERKFEATQNEAKSANPSSVSVVERTRPFSEEDMDLDKMKAAISNKSIETSTTSAKQKTKVNEPSKNLDIKGIDNPALPTIHIESEIVDASHHCIEKTFQLCTENATKEVPNEQGVFNLEMFELLQEAGVHVQEVELTKDEVGLIPISKVELVKVNNTECKILDEPCAKPELSIDSSNSKENNEDLGKSVELETVLQNNDSLSNNEKLCNPEQSDALLSMNLKLQCEESMRPVTPDTESLETGSSESIPVINVTQDTVCTTEKNQPITTNNVMVNFVQQSNDKQIEDSSDC